MLVVSLVAVTFPTYLDREDFTDHRARSLAALAAPEYARIIPWLRAHSLPTDVFLSTEADAESIIGPAGRKVVLVGAAMSNPYVDWLPRAEDHAAMWSALEVSDCVDFIKLASEYRVTRVMTHAGRSPVLADPPCGLRRAGFDGETFTVYRFVE